uniref:MHC class I-like antigen recognition-like domain-containing protein n=1 Tax=Pelusios castaneus TaxID=367368 RepID=A0A8C8VMY3_9SAUR
MTSNQTPSLPTRMLLFVFFVGALCCAGHGAALHTFTMLHLAHVANSSAIEFQGNATLNGVLTHSLQDGQASQLLPLEPPARWQEMERDVQTYLVSFHGLVQVVAKERQMQYPLDLRCKLGCQLGSDGTSHSFYKVALNGDDFLSFQAANASWALLGHREGDTLATFTHTQLNQYPQTTSELQAFLETTCMEFLRRHSKADSAKTEGQHRRSHAPLALGLTVGAFALAALAIGVFLYTGGWR